MQHKLAAKIFSILFLFLLVLIPLAAIYTDIPGTPPEVRGEIINLPGINKSYKIIFLSDSHISLCDERDNTLTQKAAARYDSARSKEGVGADDTFRTLMNYVKSENPDLLILGGDILDSAMYASIEFVKDELDTAGVPYLFTMGNHDFEYGDEYFTQTAYSVYLPRLDDLRNTSLDYQILETDDFTIFAVDDKGSQVSEEALDAFLTLKKSGKPVLLVTHVPIEPIESEDLCMLTKQVWGEDANGNSKVLMGYGACIPNETTTDFINEVCADDSPVFLVLAGHIHFYHKDSLGPQTTQITAGAAYEGELLNISLIP